MKTLTFLLLVFWLPLFSSGHKDSGKLPKKEIPEVQKLDRTPKLYKSENMYFCGQPNLETIEWLKTQGVDLIVNLRSEEENDDFAESSFNEKDIVAKLEIKYISIPIDGYDSYTTENLAKFADALNQSYHSVLIHCGSGGRVTNFMMAYLVDYKDYPLADAIEFGKQLSFKFPLEYLLKEDIVWNTK